MSCPECEELKKRLQLTEKKLLEYGNHLLKIRRVIEDMIKVNENSIHEKD